MNSVLAPWSSPDTAARSGRVRLNDTPVTLKVFSSSQKKSALPLRDSGFLLKLCFFPKSLIIICIFLLTGLWIFFNFMNLKPFKHQACILYLWDLLSTYSFQSQYIFKLGKGLALCWPGMSAGSRTSPRPFLSGSEKVAEVVISSNCLLRTIKTAAQGQKGAS